MFLPLSHTHLDVYKICRFFVFSCYEITGKFPAHEKYALTQQIRRSAISTYLNIAEGSSRKTINERNRFYEIARGSLIETDAALDIALGLNYIDKEELNPLGSYLERTFQMLTRMIKPPL